jgi:hypothetical protein
MNPARIYTWFIMAMYGLPVSALAVLDAAEGFVRTKQQPGWTLGLLVFGYGVVAFGWFVMLPMIKREEQEKRDDVRKA